MHARPHIKTGVILPLLLVVLLAACGGSDPTAGTDGEATLGADSTPQDIVIEKAWARPVALDAEAGDTDASAGEHAMMMGSNSAAYMLISNNTDSEDRLLSASVGFATVELHETTVDDGVARMELRADGVAVPPGETTALEPGGLHLMLIDVQQPLEFGESFDLTLSFEMAGDIAVTVVVRDP